MPPIHDTPILGMTTRPPVSKPTEYGSNSSFWVEYPSGLVDLSRSHHLPDARTGTEGSTVVNVNGNGDHSNGLGGDSFEPPAIQENQVDVPVDGGRTVRIDAAASAVVIIDMQNFFLHPDLRDHPTGLKCVDPLLNVVPALRKRGVKVLWVNWGLTDPELKTIPPSLVRGFMKSGKGGFGAELPGGFGRLLMRGAYNSDLYGPLQDEYLKGKEAGTDFWIHKNRMSGIWGYQSSLDLFLEENGITTLFFAGVNADQCVLGTLVDAYYRGYDCITLQDGVATTSPEGGLSNMLYNAGNDESTLPVHDTPILGMTTRPHVSKPTEYGNSLTFWVEYPSGLVDLSRSHHLVDASVVSNDGVNDGDSFNPPAIKENQVDVSVDGGRTVRIDTAASAVVIIDMQNYFLHPDLRDHPTGLKCVDPLLNVVPALRERGVKILWVNWGLTDHELTTIPPSLIRSMKKPKGGFGDELAGGFGRLLMRGAHNSDLYGPLQDEYLKGKEADFWIHKNRMSALWGYQSSLDLFLQENGVTTLFFAGVNADQCVLGTVVDAYFRGYDCVALKDGIATTSPEGGLSNMLYNTGNSYGFVTDTTRVITAMK